MKRIKESVAILTITSEQQSSWDSNSKTLSIELRYNYSIDGIDYGAKLVDEGTRQQFLKLIFDISDNLIEFGCNKNLIITRIQRLGESLYNLMIPEKLQNYLSKTENEVLLIRTTDQDIPWEIMYDQEGFLCHRIAFGRDLPYKPNKSPKYRKGINICLIGNPTSNLPGAEAEIMELRNKLSDVLESLHKTYGIETNLKILKGDDATKSTVLFETLINNDKNWDIIHFAGHAKFNSSRPESSGLMLSDGELKAFEVENLGGSPIFFINACHSGLTINQNAMTGYGLFKGIAASFIKGGALGYIGSLWAIEDRTAQIICEHFYKAVLDGAGIGEALLEAKKTAFRLCADPGAIGYMLYGNPGTKLPVFEPNFAYGPYVNEQGFERILELEKEYSGLEILLVNDLPWILWRPEDFISWVSRIPASESRRNRMQKILFDYQRNFRKLIIEGSKKFVGITNLKVLRKYLLDKSPNIKSEIVADIRTFSEFPNFTLLLFEAIEDEMEEIEIISKNSDPYINLNECVYVFNKQVRFEQRPPSYSVHLNFDTSLIKEYTDRFYNYYNKCVEQYTDYYEKDWNTDINKIPNSKLNQITLNIIENLNCNC